jgi:hypothetical protein
MNSKISRGFTGNSLYLKGMLTGLNDNDMMLSTGESNTIGWILGHITHYRGEILRRMKKECEVKENEKAFERGAPKNKSIKVNLAETMNDFLTRGELIANTINELGDTILKEPCGMELPGGNDIETLLAFLSWHEIFHLGQIDLIKAAAGKGGIK